MTYWIDVPVDVEGTEVICRVTYEWTPGRPAHTPRGEYAPIDPPEPPEVSFMSIKVGGNDVPMWFEIAVENSDKAYRWICEHHREPERE